MASVRNLLALNDPDPKEMSVVNHLDELRQRLIKCIITVCLGSIVGWFVAKGVFTLLAAPLQPYVATKNQPQGAEFVFNRLTDPFIVELKLSIAVGIALGLPVLLYQTWMFVAPAISVHTRRYVVPFVLLGIALFIVGMGVGYALFPLVVRFLVSQSANFAHAQLLLTIGDYVAQFGLVLVVFGAVFEMPVVLTFLSLIGIVTSRFLRSKRKIAGMLGLIAAMIITPGADPITPFVTAAIVYILYECSIIMVRLVHR